MTWTDILSIAAALGVLAAITVGLSAAFGLERRWLGAWSLARAIIHLGVLSVVLGTVIERIAYVIGFLIVMVITAAGVVGRRMRWAWRQCLTAGAVIAVAAALPSAVIFATGAVDYEANYVLAVGGIIIGGAMTVSTLFVRLFHERLIADRAILEGWLALGATPRQAARSVVQSAGSLALMPATDQTRVTGLVTLPGAFVGAVFAGLPVRDAAVFQAMVLAAILAAGSITVGLWAMLLGAPDTLAESSST